MDLPTATPGPPAGWLRRSVWARRAVMGAAVLGAGAWYWAAQPQDELPDLAGYTDITARKAAFYSFLLPQVQAVNRAILRDRQRLMHIRDELADDGDAGVLDEHWLRALAADYELAAPEPLDAQFADRLLLRVDIIAPSLALAQAANESSWGTSRFARHGNNLFGMRTHDGEGMVPRKRDEGKTFKIATYPTLRASIAAYMANLNTDFRYRRLRQIRAGLRQQGRVISGPALADGLLAYSTRGGEYIAIIQSMIRSSDLTQYDG